MDFSAVTEIGRLGEMQVAMKDFGTHGVLVTRDAGASARHEIEHRIRDLPTGQPVALDFDDVVAVSVPFADECLGQLLSGWLTGYYDEQPILAVNATDDVRETLAAALRQRHLVLLGLTNGTAELMGGDDLMNATMQAAQQLGSFTASEFAEQLGVSPQAANNRLKALVRAGALARTRVVPSGGGKEFSYAVPEVGGRSGPTPRRPDTDGRRRQTGTRLSRRPG